MKTHSFAIRLFVVYFLLMLAALVLIVGLNLGYHNEMYLSLLKEYESRAALQIGEALDDLMSEITRLSLLPIYSQRVQSCLSDAELYPYKREKAISIDNLENMKDFINQTDSIRSYTREIYFFCRTGRVLFSSQTLPSPGVIDLLDAEEYENTALYRQAHDLIDGDTNYWGDWPAIVNDEDGFVFAKIIRDRNRKEIAVMVIVPDYEAFCNHFENERKSGEHILISDANGVIRYRSDGSDAFNPPGEWTKQCDWEPACTIARIDDTQYLLTTMRIQGTNWSIMRAVAMRDVSHPFGTYMNIILATLGIVILAAVTLYMASRYVVQPISVLVEAMHRVEQGDLSVRISKRCNDEMQMLFNGFNLMTDELQKVIRQVYLAQLQQKEAQILALQSQINPHFLYNTLDSIQLVAILNQDFKASRMITSLSKLFRYAMISEPRFTTLTEEIEYAKNYVTLQQIRFENAFSLYDETQEQLGGCQMPRLTLQPLIENAIYHGLNRVTEGGEIRILARMERDRLHVIIRDNGAGMSAQQCCALRESLMQGEDSALPTQHIGILNVNTRLRTIYGEDAGLYINRSDSTGTEIELVLPQKRGESDV